MIDIDSEYDLWLQEQAQLLREIQQCQSLSERDLYVKKLDIENLIEELETLVRGETSAVESLTYQILLHLLLIDYWHEESEWNRDHWASEITGFRLQLKNKLTTNLKNHVLKRFDFLYQKAHQAAINKTKSSIRDERFPIEPVYGFDNIIDDNFLGKNR